MRIGCSTRHALWASIGGTMALTLIIIWLVWIFWHGGWSIGTELARIDKLGLIAILLTIIMGVVMVSLGACASAPAVDRISAASIPSVFALIALSSNPIVNQM